MRMILKVYEPKRVLQFLGLAAAVALTMSARAENVGVESSNPADRPPVMSPDVASRTSPPDGPPSYGPEDAIVVIALFSDYQCPSCRRANQASHQISAEFPGEVRIEVWHLPVPSHSKAELAAIAAVAAQKQGEFWPMHDLIFEKPAAISVQSLEGYAGQLGLDLERFRADMNDPAVKERVARESELAVTFGAVGTPSWLINGKFSRGWGSWNGFRHNVEREVKEARKLAEQGMSPSEIREQRALANMTDSESFALYREAMLTRSGDGS